MATITYTGKLETTQCWCGIGLAVPADQRRRAERELTDEGWRG